MVQQCRQLGQEHHAYLQHAVQAAAAALHADYALLSAWHSAWLQQLDQQPLRQVSVQGRFCVSALDSRPNRGQHR